MIDDKRREITPKIWRFHIFFVPLPPKRIKKEKMDMKTTLTIENIYSMLSSLSVNNKKWLADHLYEDISGVQVRRRRGALSDEELEAELSGSPLLDMNDYEPLTDEQFKGLVHSRPIPISLEKWL